MRAPVINRPSQNVSLNMQTLKFRRAKRQGQVVPNPNRGYRGTRRPADEEAGDAGVAVPSTSGRSGEETDHERRNRRREEAWAAERVEMIRDVYASAPAQKEQQQQQA